MPAGILTHNGQEPIHGSNMDQSPEAVRNVTLRVTFVNGSGTPVFEGVDWYSTVQCAVLYSVEPWPPHPLLPFCEALPDVDARAGPRSCERPLLC